MPALNLNNNPVREGLPFLFDRSGENESLKRWRVAEAVLKSWSLTPNPLLASLCHHVKGILWGEKNCPEVSHGKLSWYSANSKVDYCKTLMTERLKEQVKMLESRGLKHIAPSKRNGAMERVVEALRIRSKQGRRTTLPEPWLMRRSYVLSLLHQPAPLVERLRGAELRLKKEFDNWKVPGAITVYVVCGRDAGPATPGQLASYPNEISFVRGLVRQAQESPMGGWFKTS